MAPRAGGDATSTTAGLDLPRQTEEDLWLDTSQIDFHRVGKIPGETRDSSTMWLRLEGGNNQFAAKLKSTFQYFPYWLL